MRRIKQLILTLLCLSMVMTSAIGTAYADTTGYTVNAAAGQSEATLKDELYQQWANACNGKFSAEALKEFAVNLKNEYVPRVLYGITQKFTFARPSAEGMKIGLELVYKDNSKAELASVTSNGKEYKLSINMAALENTDDGKVDVEGDKGAFFGSLTHEMMHAVMFDAVSAGMLADRVWHGNGFTEYVDEFPRWFYEGICQTVGGGIEWCDALMKNYDKCSVNEQSGRENIIKWLREFYYYYKEYAQGYIACLYLGHLAGGSTDTVTADNIAKGLDAIVLDLADGYSLSQTIYRRTQGKYTSIEDLQRKFAADAYDFTIKFLDITYGGTSDINWASTGSVLAAGGLKASKLEMYRDFSGKSYYFTLDISCGGMCDNSSLLPAGRPDRTGGGNTMTKGLRRDGSINTDARKLWTETSYKEPAEPETPTKPGTGGGTVTPPSGGGGGGGTVAPPAGGGGGGGGAAVPPAETQKPEEPTQSGTTTTADLSGSTTSQGGQTTTTVDQTTADRLVETAVSGKSEEIVISAVTKNTSAALSVKSSEVALPVETLQKIADKTNADIVIKTDVAEVKLDNKAAEAVAAQTHSETAGKAETVSIAVEKVKEAAKEVHYELKVVTSEGKTISDFKGGSVSVTVNVPKSLSNKKAVCVYIDGQGNYHKVAGKLNADGTYTFTTGHFSAYAVMPEEEADAAIAAQKAAVKQIKLKLSSKLVNTKSGKKGIRLTWKNPSDIKLEGVEIYRSLKKNSGYGKKPISTPKSDKYTNTSVKSGKKYYYKARGYVTIDGEKVYTSYSGKASRTVK